MASMTMVSTPHDSGSSESTGGQKLRLQRHRLTVEVHAGEPVPMSNLEHERTLSCCQVLRTKRSLGPEKGLASSEGAS